LTKALRSAAIAGSCILLLAGCGTTETGQALPVKRENIRADLVATGIVAPAVQSKLNFRVSGIFRGYKVAAGDHVDANQPLAVLDAPDQDLALAKAEYDLATAKSALATAISKLQATQNGPRPGSVEQANGNLAAAQAKLAHTAGAGRATDVAAKQAALDAEKAKLQLMLEGGRPEAIARGQATLDQAKAKLQALQNGPRPEQIAVWRGQLEQAKDSLLAAQISRDAACGSSGAACDAANAQVLAAQSGVDVSARQLAVNTAPPVATDLAQAQAAATAAQQDLELAKRPYSELEVQQQRDAVAVAEQALRNAQQPFTSDEIAQAQAGVQSARGALTEAQQPYTDQDLSQAQAAVDQAQAQVTYAQAGLDNARLNRDNTTLTAPYSGTVLEENAKPGEGVGPVGVSTTSVQTTGGEAVSTAGNAAILLASDEGLAVNLSIGESDIARVQLGEEVTLGFDAYPGRQYHGKVTFVPHLGDTVQNVQQYIAKVAINADPSLPPPKPGMTASCVLPFQKSGVVAVPNGAVFRDPSGQPIVVIKDGASGHSVHVQTGIADSQNTEIVSGLKEGEQVLVGSTAAKMAAAPSPAH